MRKLVYTPASRADLLSIFEYITRESRSLESGRRFTDLIRDKCRNMASLPGTLGRARPELRPDLRSVAFRGYVIFFRYQDNVLEVVNVLHAHRDLDAYFDDETD